MRLSTLIIEQMFRHVWTNMSEHIYFVWTFSSDRLIFFNFIANEMFKQHRFFKQVHWKCVHCLNIAQIASATRDVRLYIIRIKTTEKLNKEWKIFGSRSLAKEKIWILILFYLNLIPIYLNLDIILCKPFSPVGSPRTMNRSSFDVMKIILSIFSS